MTEFTGLACFLARAHLMALPALFVNYDFRAEGFIRDADGIGRMAGGACVYLLFDLFRFVVANLALDRRRLEVIGMRRIQLLRVYLMVTLDTWDRALLYVDLMRKGHLAYR